MARGVCSAISEVAMFLGAIGSRCLKGASIRDGEMGRESYLSEVGRLYPPRTTPRLRCCTSRRCLSTDETRARRPPPPKRRLTLALSVHLPSIAAAFSGAFGGKPREAFTVGGETEAPLKDCCRTDVRPSVRMSGDVRKLFGSLPYQTLPGPSIRGVCK